MKSVDGFALDIGGSWARWYHFQESVVVESDRERLEGSGSERIEAICRLLLRWEYPECYLPTACAGRKDGKRVEVTASHFAQPLPGLCAEVNEGAGVWLGPLWDDDVCAGWGHLASPRGGLREESPNTLLLTGGTGLAECLWVEGKFLLKGTYPGPAELGLESCLRAEAWRRPRTAEVALRQLLEARQEFNLERVLLSGKLAEIPELDLARVREQLKIEVERVPLEEAPGLGALYLTQRDRAQKQARLSEFQAANDFDSLIEVEMSLIRDPRQRERLEAWRVPPSMQHRTMEHSNENLRLTVFAQPTPDKVLAFCHDRESWNSWVLVEAESEMVSPLDWFWYETLEELLDYRPRW